MNYQTCRKCNVNKPLSEFYNNEHSKRCKECERERKKLERQKRSHHRTDKNKRLKKQYGISIEQYEEILVNQNNLCSICKEEDVSKYKTLNVDHCHKTGQIRGLLCQGCNLGLGHFKDNIKILEQAIKYLEQWQK